MQPEEMSIEDVRMLCHLLLEMSQFKTNIIDSLHAKIQNKESFITFLKAVNDQLFRINQDQQKQIQHLKNEIATFEKHDGKGFNLDNTYHDVILQETTFSNVSSTNIASTTETQFGSHVNGA